MNAKIEAKDLVMLLRERYPAKNGGYNPAVVLEQVPDGTSWAQGRWIDVAVFQMWQTKGLTRSAFEIKISRTDFLQELQHPEKHQWCKDCFHYFYFVAPKDVVQLEELPAGVGFMYPRGNKLSIARHAVKNDNPKLDDSLLAGFMRAAHKEIGNSTRLNSEEVLNSSDAYKKTSQYMKATLRFLEDRGVSYPLPESTDDIFKALEEATMDKQLKQDRDHLLGITSRFQNGILDMLDLFLLITNRSLLARDELGKYIVNAYGGQDDSLKALKELKSSKTRDSRKRYIELMEVLLNWDKELNI